MTPLRAVALASGTTAAIWTRTGTRRGDRILFGAASDDPPPVSTTHFISSDGREVAARPGIYMVVADKLYRWMSDARTSASRPCDGGRPSVFRKHMRFNSVLVPVGSGDRIVIEDFARANKKVREDLVEIEEHEPVAVLGDALFVRTVDEYLGCGAHASHGAAFEVARVHPDGTVDKLAMSTLSEGVATRLEDAIKELNPAKGSEIEVTMGVPVFGAREAQWTVQYTAGASHAGA